MSTFCYTPWKVPTVRVTQLNSCGQAVTGCSTITSNGIISIAMTNEYEARQEFFVKNGDGTFCVKATNPPILKWINLVLTFCNVDPDMAVIMAGETVVSDNSSSANHTGYNTTEGSAALVNFALEAWTRIAPGSVSCTGGQEYGYTLFPYIVEGTIGDVTYENNTASFIVNARTSANSLWGTGPYNVDYSDNPAGSTTPIPLLTPILSTQHKRMFLTRLAPPAGVCGCQTLSSLTPS